MKAVICVELSCVASMQLLDVLWIIRGRKNCQTHDIVCNCCTVTVVYATLSLGCHLWVYGDGDLFVLNICWLSCCPSV